MGMKINIAILHSYNKQMKIYTRIKRTNFGTITEQLFVLFQLISKE